jgi:hypothetical protein
MRIPLALAATLAACTACQNSIAVRQDEEIVASTRYDDVECAALAAERDALAARYGLAPTLTREPLPESATPGFGIFIPDARSEDERAKAKAIGEISAMNRSMERRRCGRS